MQKTVSISTAEAEYCAASEMAIEVLFLRCLLANMGFPEEPNTPVYEDNTAAVTGGATSAWPSAWPFSLEMK